MVRLVRRVRSVFAALCILGAAALGRPGTAAAQESPAPPAADSVRPAHVVSPRGAFLRNVAIPGWGHASIGSFHRGAVYFAAETASFWMFAKSRNRLMEARRRAAAREDFLRDGAALDGIDDLSEIQELLDGDEVLADLLGLQEARRQQREDWAALGIFLMLLSGADAYVSAHLKDFPAPIELTVFPAGDGRMELRVGVTLPR